MKQFIKKHKTKILSAILSLIVAIPTLIIPSILQARNDLFVSTEVKNITEGTGYHNQVNAKPGETVAYSIYIKNYTERTLENVRVKHQINPNLIYENGSNQLLVGDDVTPLPDGITTTGVKIRDLEPLRAVVVNYKARVKNSAGTGICLRQVATVTSGDLRGSDSTALVCVNDRGNQSQYSPNLEVTKKAVNLGANPGSIDLRSRTGWAKRVSAKPGDTVAFYIYVHNNRPDGSTAVAREVRVKDVVPGRGATITDEAVVTSSNAGTVRDTATVNLNTASLSEYIKGSTKMFYLDAQGREVWRPLADGVVSSNGVYIGEVYPCWNRGVYVYFQMKIKGEVPGRPNIERFKKAYNTTQKIDADKTQAKEGDIIEYILITKNSGNAVAKNVEIKDNISDIKDNVYHWNINNGGNLFGDFVVWPTRDLAPDERLDYRFKVKVKPQEENSDCEMINTYGNYTVRITIHCPPKEIIIRRHKSAYNLSEGKDATTVVAEEGDIIEYTLKTSNWGDKKALDFVVRDDIRNVLDNAEVTELFGGHMEGVFVVYPGVDIGPGKEVTNKFRVRVKPQTADESDCLMRNQYDNEIIIRIFCPIIVKTPYIVLEKMVRNVSRGETVFVKENTGYSEDTLEYLITLKSTGDAQADLVKLWDVLPSLVGKLTHPAGIFSPGLNLETLNPGETKTFKIKVKVEKNVAEGSILENCAFVTARGDLKAQSCAKTKILVEKEVPEPKVKGITKLPPTGAGIALVLSLTLAGGSGYLYWRKKKELR